MKAIVRETYGSPDVLHLEEVPLPTVRDDDVLVRVRAASANAGDWHLLRGTPFPFRLVAGLRTPKFRIIGSDVAGHVEAVGRNVTRFRPGDEVFGELSRCGFGAYAEFVRPVIDCRFALSEVPSAVRYVEDGHARGKVVVTV